MMRIRSWAQTAVPVALVVVLTASVFSASLSPAFDLLLVQVPAAQDTEAQAGAPLLRPADWRVAGARIVLLPASGGDPVVLTPEFYAACDPDVSFDGLSIVFSGKKEDGDNWHIWKMRADGSDKVQITRGDADDVSPVFAGSRFYLDDPAPTPQIVFASNRHGWRNEGGGGAALALYGVDFQGETVRRLTFNLNSDFSPDVLPDGRIVFSSWQRTGDVREPSERVALFAVNLDGTDLMPYYGNHEAPAFKGLTNISDFDDRVYFVETDTPVRFGGGHIASVSQRRPLRSYRRVTADGDGSYLSPVPLPDAGLLASYRANQAEARFALYSVDSESGERLELVFDEPGWHSIDAQVLALRPRPKGKSNWLIPGSTTGVFYGLNVYRTNLFEGQDLAPGSVRYVRVVEGLPYRGGDDNGDREAIGSRRLLGIAPVAEDGSFHVRVPAETPMTFQLLDEQYLMLREQRAWTWVIGNENRGCIGCHEDRELSPPNRMVDAVLEPAVELTLPPERRRTVDFLHQAAPILRSRCATAGCHAEGAALPNLRVGDLETQVDQARAAYGSLLDSGSERGGERYVVPGKARESLLIWTLFGRVLSTESGAASREVKQMPPHETLSLRERLLLTEWVDLGALWNARTAIDTSLER